MKIFNLFAVVVLVGTPLGVAAVGVAERAPAEGAASLTVYTGNLALVRQEVERPLGVGAHTVRIEGLATNLDPSSLVVLNPGVTVLGAHGFRSYQDVASGPGASIDLDLEVERSVERLQLAYLTTGLSWSASYAMIVAQNDASARFDGFATLANNSGTGFEAAEFQLLAGTIQRGAQGRPYADAVSELRAIGAPAEAPALQGAAFGDYHLYTVSTPLSLRAGESRRIRLMGAPSAVTTKEYIFSHSVNYYQSAPEPMTQPVAVTYRVERPEKSELGGVPLPAGQVRILQRDDAGRMQLLGIAAIGNAPRGEDLRLGVGYAFDIIGTRTQTDYRRPGGNAYESAWRVELRNRSDDDVTVQVIEQLSGDWQIIESTHHSEKVSAGAVRFRVDVGAGGAATLEYRVTVRT